MFNCCKSDHLIAHQRQNKATKSNYKYSFKKQTYVPSRPQSEQTGNQNQQFEKNKTNLRLEGLNKQQKSLNSLVLGSVQALEEEVSFYEKQVNLRSNEIHQLFHLLNLAISYKQSQITNQFIQ